jgi:hypothetical protein
MPNVRAWDFFSPAVNSDLASRATAETVGFLGDPNDLIVLDYGDPTPPEWSAVWVAGTALECGANIIIDGYQINATVVTDAGFNIVIRNSKILPPAVGTGAGVLSGGPLAAGPALLIEDSDVVGGGQQGSAVSCNNGGKVEANRCRLSGFEDAASFGAWRFNRCYMRTADGATRHCDCIQELIFDDSWVLNSDLDASGDPLNPNIGVTGALTIICNRAVIHNNRLDGGAYPLRFNPGAGLGVDGATITNNNWGPLHTVGPHNVPDPTMIATGAANWDENRESDGSLIPRPS